MPRPDGRIEPGQPLRGAISARAWNRAQDAADVVLGANTGILALPGHPSARSLSMPMLINNGTGGTSNTFPPGTVVVFSQFSQATARRTTGELGSALTSPYEGYLEMPSGVATVHVPLDVTPLYAPKTVPAWGVTTEGGQLGQSIVPVIVAGVAPVRVRSMTYGYEAAHPYAIPSIRRSGAEDVGTISGVLETTKCSCENAAKIIYIDGQTVATTGGSETAQCFWALVVI